MDFNSIKLKIASPEEILKWSHGEVLKPETINYRTQRPEREGLFCERIFGPEKDWECYCGKYKRIRYKGIVCNKCGVEVTRSIVRRERMGHIVLAAPVSHIWFLRGMPSKIGMVLGIPAQRLEKVIYFAAYIITKVDEEQKGKALKEIEKEYQSKIKSMPRTETKFLVRGQKHAPYRTEGSGSGSKSPEGVAFRRPYGAGKNSEIIQLKEQRDRIASGLKNLAPLEIISENQYQNLSQKFAHIFEAGTGAGVIRKVLEKTDLSILKKQVEILIKKEKNEVAKRKILLRLKLINSMFKNNIRPEWMILTALPVLPPDLRPMVALDGGRYATSDLNDLYRRVINRNNRLKKLQELTAPEVIQRNEKRMLQEAVDALIDNSARMGQGPVQSSTGQKRTLKSLADMLKGKQGRFRQNLLGKRVDYSGRSVIVVGPELALNECGLPKIMALELFKPFIINKIIERELAFNIKGANRLIDKQGDEIWEILEEVIKDKLVFLNRAPTLHRLGIQAFKIVLIEGLAIQIHPLVCRAFNADFDGDQMAVHLPLTEKAQQEAREIIFSPLNMLKPATGEPIINPDQDIVLGIYYLTGEAGQAKGENKIFASAGEAILAHHLGGVDLQAKIKVRLENNSGLTQTTVGRLIFNKVLPPKIEFINFQLRSRELRALVSRLIEECDNAVAADVLNKIKAIGFEYATVFGLSWSMTDLNVPSIKEEMMRAADSEVENIHNQYQEGLLSREERKMRTIEVWFKTIEKMSKETARSLSPLSPVWTVIDSKARGSWSQVNQIIGLKGLVINPAGEIIELPVKSSFKEGFNVLEYFISTHGARKGTVDTAMRTSSAGYLTRRLVDVVQDVVITEADCKSKEGIDYEKKEIKTEGIPFVSKIVGRTLAEEIVFSNNLKISAGSLIDKKTAQLIEEDDKIEKVKTRSVLTCRAEFGICQKCYGYNLGNNRLINIGQSVGIVAAQAIGEPGTQLTMRTFHTGGVAGSADITQGLPRVEEIFEARVPKGRAIISEIDGRVSDILQASNQKVIEIAGEDSEGKKIKKDYNVAPNIGIWVKKDELVFAGQQICEGHLDLKELLSIAGKAAVQKYILKEVQNIYSSQGEAINDKHIELIIKQMFSRIKIKDPGDTALLKGDIIEKSIYLRENARVKKLGKKPAQAEQLILGISKVALSSASWLSSASFQETARVLINAASYGSSDPLRGLKENVIIGRLIPAGTGFRK